MNDPERISACGSFTDCAEEIAADAFPRDAYFAQVKEQLWPNVAQNYVDLGRVSRRAS